jgi:hypothetical protein
MNMDYEYLYKRTWRVGASGKLSVRPQLVEQRHERVLPRRRHRLQQGAGLAVTHGLRVLKVKPAKIS